MKNCRVSTRESDGEIFENKQRDMNSLVPPHVHTPEAGSRDNPLDIETLSDSELPQCLNALKPLGSDSSFSHLCEGIHIPFPPQPPHTQCTH